MTRVDHLLLMPIQVPPGLNEDGNCRVLSEITSLPCWKNRLCKSCAVRLNVLSHCKFGSVKTKRETLSPRIKSIVDAHKGMESLTHGIPFKF
jgi:hypothetical protein